MQHPCPLLDLFTHHAMVVLFCGLLQLMHGRCWEFHDLHVCRAVAVTLELKQQSGFGPKLKDFKAALDKEVPRQVKDLKADVEEFAKQFPTIGFDKGLMKYTT